METGENPLPFSLLIFFPSPLYAKGKGKPGRVHDRVDGLSFGLQGETIFGEQPPDDRIYGHSSYDAVPVPYVWCLCGAVTANIQLVGGEYE